MPSLVPMPRRRSRRMAPLGRRLRRFAPPRVVRSPAPRRVVPRAEATVHQLDEDLPGGARTLDSRAASRSRRRSPSCAADAERRLRAARTTRSRSRFIPDDPGRNDEPGGWRKLQWNFSAPPASTRPTRGTRARRRRARRPRRGRRGASTPASPTRRRGRFRRAPDLHRPLRAAATTSSTTTATPTTRRPRHPRRRHDRPERPTTACGVDRARLRREDHAACACSTPTARATRSRSRAAIRYAAPQRRRRDQPEPRVRLLGTARADPRHHLGDPLRAPRRASSWSRRPATSARTRRSPTRRAPAT